MASLAALALLLTVSKAQTPTIVDFESKAAPLSVILKRLSDQTGTSLRATTALGDEVVFLSVRGSSLAEIKEQLAKALDAGWSKNSATEYLNRTSAQTRALYDRHLVLRRRMVDGALADLSSVLEKKFDGGALAAGLLSLPPRSTIANDPLAARRGYEEERRLFEGGPLGRLVRRLVLACRPEDLAGVGPYERRVFSPNPTAAQFGFDPDKFEAAAKAFSLEQQAWLDAAKAVTFSDLPEGRMVSDPRGQLRYSPALPAELRLVIRRGDMAQLFMANLVMPADGGISHVVAQLMVDDNQRRFLDASMLAKPDEKDPPIELSANSQALARRMSDVLTGARGTPPSAELLELLLRPETTDPLSLSVSDGLFALARSRGKNIVARLPDTAFNIAWFASRESPLRINAFRRSLLDSGTLTETDDGDWLRYVPADSYETSLQFTARRPMGQLITSMSLKGRLDIRDYADYAYRSKRITRTGLGEMYMMMYDASASSGLDRTDWDGLRLYGSFDANAQRALEAGAKYPFGGLNPEQKKIVERIVYGDVIQSEVAIEPGTRQHLSLPVEPTQDFASGLPAGGFVTAHVKAMPVLVAYGKGGKGSARPLRTLNEPTLATILLEGIGNEEMMKRYGVSGLTGFAMGEQKMISLRVELRPGLWKSSTISVLEPDPNALPVDWEKLPEERVKAIKQSIEQLKNRAPDIRPVRPPSLTTLLQGSAPAK